MFRYNHKTLIIIAGSIWFAIGAFLLNMGLRFLVESGSQLHAPLPLLSFFAPLIGGFQQASLFLIVLGMLIGFFKARYVLKRSVDRMVNRINSFPEPILITQIYNLPYYILLGSMILLGVSIKYLGVPYDIRGMIDVAIGAALINGAMLYFRKIPKKA
jgi:hypothetical protein